MSSILKLMNKRPEFAKRDHQRLFGQIGKQNKKNIGLKQLAIQCIEYSVPGTLYLLSKLQPVTSCKKKSSKVDTVVCTANPICRF